MQTCFNSISPKKQPLGKNTCFNPHIHLRRPPSTVFASLRESPFEGPLWYLPKYDRDEPWGWRIVGLDRYVFHALARPLNQQLHVGQLDVEGTPSKSWCDDATKPSKQTVAKSNQLNTSHGPTTHNQTQLNPRLNQPKSNSWIFNYLLAWAWWFSTCKTFRV